MKLRRIDFYPADWLEGTTELSYFDEGVYGRICWLICARGGPITFDLLMASKKCHGNALFAAVNRLEKLGKIIVNGSEIHQERCMKEIEEAEKRLAKAAGNTPENAQQSNDTNEVRPYARGRGRSRAPDRAPSSSSSSSSLIKKPSLKVGDSDPPAGEGGAGPALTERLGDALGPARLIVEQGETPTPQSQDDDDSFKSLADILATGSLIRPKPQPQDLTQRLFVMVSETFKEPEATQLLTALMEQDAEVTSRLEALLQAQDSAKGNLNGELSEHKAQ